MNFQAYSIVRVVAFVLFFPALRFVRVPISARLAVCVAICIFVFSNNSEQLFRTVFLASDISSYALLDFQKNIGLIFLEFSLGLILALISSAVFFAVNCFVSWITSKFVISGETIKDSATLWPETVKLAFSLLIALALIRVKGLSFMLEPLLDSLTRQLTFDTTELLLLIISMGTEVFKFSLILAIPFFLMFTALDIFQMFLLRFCNPLGSDGLVEVVRSVLIILLLSLGIMYVEYSSVEFANTWEATAKLAIK